MAPAHRDAVQENHRDRIFQHLEAELAEKQHRNEQHPADQFALIEKCTQFNHHRRAFARHDIFERSA